MPLISLKPEELALAKFKQPRVQTSLSKGLGAFGGKECSVCGTRAPCYWRNGEWRCFDCQFKIVTMEPVKPAFFHK